MNVKHNGSPSAPRLHPRRLWRIYFFPWILGFCAILLAILSLHIGTDWRFVFLFTAILLVSFVLKDLTSPQSRLTRTYYQIAHLFGFNIREGMNLEEETVVYIHYSDPPLFAIRGYMRWGLYLGILIILGLYAVYQSRHPTTATAIERGVLVFLILFFSLLIFSRFVSMPLEMDPTFHVVFWILLLCWHTATAVMALMALLPFPTLVGFAGMIFLTVTTALVVSQRLWADSYTLKKVLYELTRDLLSWPRTHQNLNGAAARIGNEFGHDRVFILLANEERTCLQIKDQFGVQTSIYDEEIPLDNSICGRAFREKTEIVWNDVHICPYFHRLPGDDTAAEIAVPIKHQDVVYGVLDVQSTHAGVFGPTDLETFQTAAQALGTAIAASRSVSFFDEALNLWEQISEPIHPPKNDPTSSLICLVKKWQPYFEEEGTALR